MLLVTCQDAPTIFVYKLLSEYSFILLSCVNNSGGYGPRMWLNLSVPYEIRDTSQFALDEILLSKFLQYEGRVSSIHDAEYVFVPFLFLQLERMYAKLRPSCGLVVEDIRTTAKRHVERVILPLFMEKLLGQDDVANRSLILSMSRVTMTYVKSWLRISVAKARFIFVALEKSRNDMMMVPYPSVFHSIGSLSTMLPAHARRILLTFGSPRLRPPNGRTLSSKLYGPAYERRSKKFRNSLYRSLLAKNHPSINILDAHRFSLKGLYEAMAHSKFCLQPPGDSPTRRGFYDSILLGCVPVIFSSKAYKFDFVSTSHIAVILSKEAATKDDSYVLNAVTSISTDVLASYQFNVSKVQRMMQYSLFNDPYDAFGSLIKFLKCY